MDQLRRPEESLAVVLETLVMLVAEVVVKIHNKHIKVTPTGQRTQQAASPYVGVIPYE